MAALGLRLLGFVGLGGVSPLLLLAGALALVSTLGGLYVGIEHHGYARAAAQCETAALRARVAELQTQLQNANDRAIAANAVILDLTLADVDASARLDALRDEVAKAKLQSTQPGAKPDANAILTDQCLLTERGARRLRGR